MRINGWAAIMRVGKTLGSNGCGSESPTSHEREGACVTCRQCECRSCRRPPVVCGVGWWEVQVSRAWERWGFLGRRAGREQRRERDGA